MGVIIFTEWSDGTVSWVRGIETIGSVSEFKAVARKVGARVIAVVRPRKHSEHKFDR